MGSFSITCKFKDTLDQFVWALSEVYGPNMDSDRWYQWEELVGVLSWWENRCCIGRDFNVTHFLNERYGESQLTSAMKDFFRFYL